MTAETNAVTEDEARANGAASASLIIVGIVFALVSLTGLGAVPVVMMVLGLGLTIKDGDITPAVYTTRAAQALIVGLAFFVYVIGQDAGDQAPVAYTMAAAIAAFALLLEWVWLSPIRANLPVWRQSRDRKKARASAQMGRSIIKRDALAPYSVADELIKWNRLREDGLVTEQQFEEARAKLLAGN